MKKLLISFLFILMSLYNYSQNTFPTQGNVGVGTTNPHCTFNVVGGTSLQGTVSVDSTFTVNDTMRVSDDVFIGGNANINGNIELLGEMYTRLLSDSSFNGQKRILVITSDGKLEALDIPLGDENAPGQIPECDPALNVWAKELVNNDTVAFMCPKYKAIGIGTRQPLGKLHVADGNAYFMNKIGIGTTSPNAQLTVHTSNIDNPCIALSASQTGVQGDLTYFEAGQLISLLRFDKDASGATLTFDDRTGTQPLERFKISGNGTLYAREVKVTLNTFPDYVFEKDYNRLSLLELEEYINAHKHLPNIPSAQEVKEEGIGVGELQIKMMEKIEELTLYIIEQNKKIETLEQKVNDLTK